MGRSVSLGAVISILLLAVLLLWLPPGFTGFLIYSHSTNETTAIAENTSSNFQGTKTGTYSSTKLYDGFFETLKENSSNELLWDYSFGTNYNLNQPAEIRVKLLGIKVSYTSEKINISIYNYNLGRWEFINKTTAGTDVLENITTLLSWQTRNLSHYINSLGHMNISVQDDKAGGSQTWVYIDYIALNATFSPLNALAFNISNSTGDFDGYYVNYTRGDILEAAAEWNVSSLSSAAIIINASGNVSTLAVSNLSVDWTNFTLNLSNTTIFPLGGNITLRFNASDSYYQQNLSGLGVWFGLFSNASVTAIVVNETGSVVSSTPVKVYCRVADTYSDVPIAGYNVSFYNNSNLFGYGLTNSTGWASGIYNGTTAGTDYFLNCTIGNATGIWYYNSSAWNATTAMTVVTDALAPNVTGLYLDSAGVSSSCRTNLYMNASVIANMTDSTTSVQSATLNITYPSGFFVDASMQRYESTGWRFVFADNESGIALNETGNYTVNITATDLAGNKNISWNITFNVTSNYSVVLDGYTSGIKYNRGENLTFVVLDENGVLVAGSNITANLTYPTNTVSNWYTGTNSTLMLALNGTLNVSNYTMMFFVNKSMGGNNSAYGEFRFNVTDVLNLIRADSKKATINARIGSGGSNIRFYVNNTRGGRFPYTVSANITCDDNSNYTLTKLGEYYYNDTGCTAPNAYSTTFYVRMNATDSGNNNIGSALLSITTSDSPGSGTTGGTVGGGGGTVTKNCNCEWVGVACGIGGCGPAEVFQTYNCTPAGCGNTTTRCLPSPAFCELNRRGFNFTLSRDYVEVRRGENATVMGTITNTGNLTLNISIAIGAGCCIAFLPQSVVVQNLSSLDVPITVHPALSEATGDYLFIVNATAYGLESSKGFTLRVVENPLLADMTNYQAEANQLKNDIAVYSSNGLDTGGLMLVIEELDNIISSANASAAGDRLAEFRVRLEQAKAKLDEARAQAAYLGFWNFLIENRWWILLGVIAAFIALYLVTQIAVPYVCLTREIRRMIDKEKSQVEGRKATYKDYFMGKVDEKAFEEMIIGKQSEILSTKGTLRHKMDERNALVKSKLSPEAVKDWIASGFGLRKVVAKMAAKLARKLKKQVKA